MKNNLNPFYKVWYRQANNWLRRRIVPRLFPGYYHRLLDERRHIIVEEELSGKKLTAVQSRRLGEIADALGYGVIHRLTPEQSARAVEMVQRIVAELKAEGKI